MRYPLERALRIIGELEFAKLDVAIHEDGPHIKPSEVATDVALAGVRIRIGPSLTPGAFSVKIATTEPEEYQRQTAGHLSAGPVVHGQHHHHSRRT